MEPDAELDAFVDSLFRDSGDDEVRRARSGGAGGARGVEYGVDSPALPWEVHGASPAGIGDWQLEGGRNAPHAEAVAPAAREGGTSGLRVADAGFLPPFDPERLFPFTHFNAMQSQVILRATQSEGSIVVAAPTGAGKTAVFEAALAAAFHDAAHAARRSVAVYISPIKALAQERTRDWARRMGQFGIRVAEATGDALPEEGVSALSRGGRLVLCTTPEKLAVLTLNGELLDRISLVLVDEVHILNEDRGGVLEAALSRLLRACHAGGLGVRFVAASASIPNAADIGEWLGCAAADVLEFGEECRPVPLSVHLEAFPDSGNPFLFDKKLTPRVASIVRAYSEGRPSLVFCPTRSSTVETARHLASADGMQRELVRDHAHRRRLEAVASGVGDARLAELVRGGVAFHNADLGPADRAAVEDTFRAGDLRVLCTTSTLAQGVNLPARLVVLKGTFGYRGAGVGFLPLPVSSVQQMVGRAGRPQYDVHGAAVIMTAASIADRYTPAALAQREPVESHLPARLNEYLSAEVALGAVASAGDAVDWVRRTFFHVRARRNPGRYGVGGSSDAAVDAAVADLCAQALQQLETAGLLERADGGGVHATALGLVATRMYLRVGTAERIGRLSAEVAHGNDALETVLRTLASAEELEGASKLRHGEKTVLNKAARSEDIPFRPKGRVQTGTDKAFLLVQLALRKAALPNAPMALRQDLGSALQQGRRVASALLQAVSHPEVRSALAPAAAFLAKAIATRCWPVQRGDELVQLKGVGPAIAKKLADAGLSTIEALAAAEPGAIERAGGRRAPWGERLQAQLTRFRPLALQCSFTGGRASAGPRSVRLGAELRIVEDGARRRAGGWAAGASSPYTLYLTASVPRGLLYTTRVSGPCTLSPTVEFVAPPGVEEVVLRATMVRSDVWWPRRELWDSVVARVAVDTAHVVPVQPEPQPQPAAARSAAGTRRGGAAKAAGKQRPRKRQATIGECSAMQPRKRGDRPPPGGPSTVPARTAPAAAARSADGPHRWPPPDAAGAALAPIEGGDGAEGPFFMAVDERGVMRRVRLMPAPSGAASGRPATAAAAERTAAPVPGAAIPPMAAGGAEARPAREVPGPPPASAQPGSPDWSRWEHRPSRTDGWAGAESGGGGGGEEGGRDRVPRRGAFAGDHPRTAGAPLRPRDAPAAHRTHGGVRERGGMRMSLRPSWLGGPSVGRPARRVAAPAQWPPATYAPAPPRPPPEQGRSASGPGVGGAGAWHACAVTPAATRPPPDADDDAFYALLMGGGEL